MTRSSNKELVTPYEEPERVLRSARKLFKTTSLDYSSSPEFDLFSDLGDQCEEEVTEAIWEPTMEEYMTKIGEDYRSGIARPKIDEKARYARGDLVLQRIDVPTRQILGSKGAISSMKAADAKKSMQDMADHSQKWHNKTSTRTRSIDTSDGLAVIEAQLNNLG
ncbi:hypothetical protein Tco_1059248, partial [Tanacetum coccineum]